MVEYEGATPLFMYAYISHDRRRTGANGFRVTIYEDDTLMYRTFNDQDEEIESSFFRLEPGTAETYQEILRHQTWWMGTVPLVISSDGRPRYTSLFGFAGQPSFQVEDLNNLALRPFGSQRGQFARSLLLMLENVASLLQRSGLFLDTDNFMWRWSNSQPFEPVLGNVQTPPPQQQAPQGNGSEDIPAAQ